MATPDPDLGWSMSDCLERSELEPLLPGLTLRGQSYRSKYRVAKQVSQDRSYWSFDNIVEDILRYLAKR